MNAPAFLLMPNRARELGPGAFDWWPDWSGKAAAVVASGESAKAADFDLLRRKCKVITVNNSWQLAPWADVLYACDGRWWGRYWEQVKDLPALKLTFDAQAALVCPDVRRILIDTFQDKILSEVPGRIGNGGNSGFQALNLAAQFGASLILLIGFDMQGDHWHERHPPPLSNPCMAGNFPRWIRHLDRACETLDLLGINVINCSDRSALNNYPKMSIARALM